MRQERWFNVRDECYATEIRPLYFVTGIDYWSRNPFGQSALDDGFACCCFDECLERWLLTAPFNANRFALEHLAEMVSSWEN